jgi:hypothetical protein
VLSLSITHQIDCVYITPITEKLSQSGILNVQLMLHIITTNTHGPTIPSVISVVHEKEQPWYDTPHRPRYIFF